MKPSLAVGEKAWNSIRGDIRTDVRVFISAVSSLVEGELN
jgi:hypothetical protein